MVVLQGEAREGRQEENPRRTAPPGPRSGLRQRARLTQSAFPGRADCGCKHTVRWWRVAGFSPDVPPPRRAEPGRRPKLAIRTPWTAWRDWRTTRRRRPAQIRWERAGGRRNRRMAWETGRPSFGGT